EFLRQTPHRVLARHVGRKPRSRRAESGGGDDIDYHSTSHASHVAGRCTSTVEGAVEVDGLHLPPLLVARLQSAERGEHTRIIDPDVEAAELSDGEVCCGVHGGGVDDVDGCGDDSGAVDGTQFRGGLLGKLSLEITEEDVGPSLSESGGNRAPQSAGGAGNDGAATAE